MRAKIFLVVPENDYTVLVFFDDGKIKRYDAKPLIRKGGIFDVLRDVDFFKSRCTILNNTLAWDISGDRDPGKCIDICPDTIYETCKDVSRDEVA